MESEKSFFFPPGKLRVLIIKIVSLFRGLYYIFSILFIFYLFGVRKTTIAFFAEERLSRKRSVFVYFRAESNSHCFRFNRTFIPDFRFGPLSARPIQ